MVWVKSEYAGELSVVSAWIAALLPWWISYAPAGPLGSSVVFFRWPAVQIRYFLGLSLGGNLDTRPVASPWGAKEIGFSGVGPAYDLWLAGALVVGLAVALSLAMYVDVERVDAVLPTSPVRLMGGLLTLAGVVLAVASVQFYRLGPTTEYPLPVGVPILLVLGASLLRVDLVESGDSPADEPASDP